MTFKKYARYKILENVTSLAISIMAEERGFEPLNGASKGRCLTAWLLLKRFIIFYLIKNNPLNKIYFINFFSKHFQLYCKNLQL